MPNKRITHSPLPVRIDGLELLAYNLWWSWHPQAQALFSAIDPALWQETYHNPVRFLAHADSKTLRAALTPSFLASYDNVMADLETYMHPTQTWFSHTFPETIDHTIAYFSPEFGLHESLPIYSGGLGILAGDHCKEASDLGIPLVAVGFLYPQGYFRQVITADGTQEAIYNKLRFADVPARAALTPDGRPVMIRVELPGRTVYAMVWHIQVGRVSVYLMDTDVEPNAPADRDLSARLYGGDHEMRVSQEMMLGIGGVRMLRALGIEPAVWHMNEGHSAFLTLERLRELVRKGVSPVQARETVRNSTVFTTHTPVPAGNDAFPFEMMEKYFWQQWIEFGMTREEFLDLARHDLPWGPRFSMTVLALRLASRYNGVSHIHGGVSRNMWRFIWHNRPVEQVPIGAITNGIHTSTWIAPEMADLYGQYLGPRWVDALDDPRTWDAVAQIPDQMLWKTRCELKQHLISFVRESVTAQYKRQGAAAPDIEAARTLLDPDALTIGFARRFATYKRATLLFRDIERLRRLVNQPGRPVQFIFAGKAHPNDEPGKALIRDIYRLAQDAALKGHIAFVEEYDMRVSRTMVQGVDVWLNTPRKPNEASGTSGQKAGLNGVPNASILDGWWAEAYNGKNGWAIASADMAGHQDAQDDADARALYELLENQIIPLFYERSADHVPHAWLSMVKETIRTVAPVFSTRRMLKDYVTQLYMIPAEAELA